MSLASSLKDLGSKLTWVHYPAEEPLAASIAGMMDGRPTVVSLVKEGKKELLVLSAYSDRVRSREDLEPIRAALRDGDPRLDTLNAKSPDALMKDMKPLEHGVSVPLRARGFLGRLTVEDLNERVGALKGLLNESLGEAASVCKCGSDRSSPILVNRVPTFLCPTCRDQIEGQNERVRSEYESMRPEYFPALLAGVVTAFVSGSLLGLFTHYTNRIFFILWAVLGLVIGGAVRLTAKKTDWLMRALAVVLVLLGFLICIYVQILMAVHDESHAFMFRQVALYMIGAPLDWLPDALLEGILTIVGGVVALVSAKTRAQTARLESLVGS